MITSHAVKLRRWRRRSVFFPATKATPKKTKSSTDPHPLLLAGKPFQKKKGILYFGSIQKRRIQQPQNQEISSTVLLAPTLFIVAFCLRERESERDPSSFGTFFFHLLEKVDLFLEEFFPISFQQSRVCFNNPF